jgi:hypothetical protein
MSEANRAFFLTTPQKVRSKAEALLQSSHILSSLYAKPMAPLAPRAFFLTTPQKVRSKASALLQSSHILRPGLFF